MATNAQKTRLNRLTIKELVQEARTAAHESVTETSIGRHYHLLRAMADRLEERSG